MTNDPSIEKLTKRAVDNSLPKEKRYFVWDSDLKGFGLRVEPSGIKSYVVRYRMNGGRSGSLKQKVIGRHGPLTPDDARSIARANLGDVARGIDPYPAIAPSATLSLKELAERYLKEHIEKKRKPNTAAFYKIMLETHVLPELGKNVAQAVTRADLARIHLNLADTPYAANRVLAVVGGLYSWAENVGLVPEGTNPAQRIEKYREHKRERFLSVAELERLGAAIRLAETDGVPRKRRTDKRAPKLQDRDQISVYAAGAIRLLMFTGCRLREILHLRWEHVDIERQVLFLPDSKTGSKTVLLNAPALEVLAGLPRLGNNPFVIPGERNNAPLVDLKRPWAAVCRAADLEGLRIHDLRHTFASFGAGSNLGLPVIGKLLGHSQPSTTARYAHLADDPMRRASDMIGGRIAAALSGTGATRGREVTLEVESNV
jgi:integrase